MSAAPHRLSIEGVVLGRNDDYEPGWTDRLYQSLRYNHSLLAAHGIDYRVAFVEWNPPAGRPLLCPTLLQEFPFLRAIVIDREVHASLCTADDLTMMLNFAYNPALRTSAADYCLITSGDLFFGRALAERIGTKGLAPRCLYRAERVNIQEGAAGPAPDPEVIEAPANIVSVDSCTEPPYDQPPYSHASGDFLLMDRVTMAGLRGFDESIRSARLHLDSRFCFTAMLAGLDCELLGRIYHVDHRNAYANRIDDYPGRNYNYDANLPYLNTRDWGLARMTWQQDGPRSWRISLPEPGTSHWTPPSLSATEIGQADDITRRLAETRAALHPDQPRADLPIDAVDLSIDDIAVLPVWINASTHHLDGTVIVTTADAPWGYSASMPLPSRERSNHWHWLQVRGTPLRGTVGVGLLQNDQLLHEQSFSAQDPVNAVLLPLPNGTDVSLMLRSGPEGGPAKVRIEAVRLLSQRKNPLPIEQFLLGSHVADA